MRMQERFLLDPSVVFLNHGSYGACPTEVLLHQQEIQRTIEHEPVRFLARELRGRLDAAREALARFLDADADGLAFVPNATTGVNAVLRSLDLSPGDELLTTDHAYNACRNTLDYVAARAQASVKVARIPLPLDSEATVIAAIEAAVTPRTRLFLLDHVTSPTALVLPAAEIVRRVQARGVDVLVDGAHVPGMLELSIRNLGAAWYTGNCHKWICAPKGAAFLFAREDKRTGVRPAVISHGANAKDPSRSRYRLEFDWTGTDDPSAYLSVPFAIRHMEELVPGGWPAIRRKNRELALSARDLLVKRLSSRRLCPDSMIGSIASIPLPPASGPGPASAFDTDPLQDRLFFEHGIEVPVMPWPTARDRLLRVSAQVYNAIGDYEKLADALAAELG